MRKEVERYANKLGMTVEEICRPGRKANYVDQRHVIWFILRKNGYKSVEIADFFNLKSHATVLYACCRIQNLLDVRDRSVTNLFRQLGIS